MDLKKVVPVILFFGICAFGGFKVVGRAGKVLRNRDQHVGKSAQIGLGFFLGLPRAQALALMPGTPLEAGDCKAYLKEIEGLNLEITRDSSLKLTYYDLPASPANCVMVDEAIIAAEKIYLGACIFANPTKADFLSAACVDGLIDFRSSLTHFLYQQKQLSDIESLPELTDLLYFEYARGRILAEDIVHPVDYRRLGAIASSMLEEAPELAGALRVKVIEAIVIATQANSFKSPKDLDTLWNDASEALVRFKKIQPNHFSNADTVAAIESRGFQGKLLLPYSVSLLEKNPNDSRAFFLKAFALWKLNEHEDSFQALKKAVDLDSKEDRYQKVLQKISLAGADEDVFRNQMELSLSRYDFDR